MIAMIAWIEIEIEFLTLSNAILIYYLNYKTKIILNIFRSKFTNKETSQQGGQQLDVVSTCPEGNSKITGQEMIWNGLKSLTVALSLIMGNSDVARVVCGVVFSG